MVEKSFRITSEMGIHARPATELVNTCMDYQSQILLTALKRVVDLKSIMGVMSLGVYSGTTITISCEGEDEEDAMQAIKDKIFELGLGKEI
jgi:phosphocarrier protein